MLFLEHGFYVTNTGDSKAAPKLVLTGGQRNDSGHCASCMLISILMLSLTPSVTSSYICKYALGKMKMYVNDTERLHWPINITNPHLQPTFNLSDLSIRRTTYEVNLE